MQTTEAQKRASKKWNDQNLKRFCLQFTPNRIEEWEYLHTKSNMSGYVLDLIRADMEKSR